MGDMIGIKGPKGVQGTQGMNFRRFIEAMLLKIPAYYRWQLKKTEVHTKKVARQIRAELVTAVKVLKKIDSLMKDQGMPRGKRKQFWRDFFKYDEMREDIFDKLLSYYDIDESRSQK